MGCAFTGRAVAWEAVRSVFVEAHFVAAIDCFTGMLEVDVGERSITLRKEAIVEAVLELACLPEATPSSFPGHWHLRCRNHRMVLYRLI